MGIRLTGLAASGRGNRAARTWTAEEGHCVKILMDERRLSRLHAADHVRNGIASLEDFDKATKKGFVPKTQEEAAEEAEPLPPWLDRKQAESRQDRVVDGA